MAQIARGVRSGDGVVQAGDRICAAAVELLERRAEAESRSLIVGVG
jgi:hypothetical protein